MTQCPRCKRELGGPDGNRPFLVCGCGYVIDACLVCGSQLVFEIAALNEGERMPDLPEVDE